MSSCITLQQIFSASHRSDASREVETIKKEPGGFSYLEMDLIPLSKEGRECPTCHVTILKSGPSLFNLPCF